MNPFKTKKTAMCYSHITVKECKISQTLALLFYHKFKEKSIGGMKNEEKSIKKPHAPL